MPRSRRVNFVRQQGLREATAAGCTLRYPALMFQPRVVGVLLLVGIVWQEALFFTALGAVLLWSALLPGGNPFDAIYNALLADGEDRPELGPAPPPRRFAQGLAGVLMLVVAVGLRAGWPLLAWGVEAFLVLAVGGLVFGDFCLGSFLYLHLTGDGAFARRTAPWASGSSPDAE